jgi:hypothetical protein
MRLHCGLELDLHGVGLETERCRQVRRHPRRPLHPGIALLPRQGEDLRRCPYPVDQLTPEPREPQLALLCLEHLVGRPYLEEARAPGRRRLALIPQRLANARQRRRRNRSQARLDRRPLLRCIGVAGPLPLDPGDVETAVGIPRAPPCRQRLADCRLAHAQGFGELPITRGPHGDHCARSTSLPGSVERHSTA